MGDPRVLSVVGTRPNFMKIAPIKRELQRRAAIEHVLVHTGQHYDPLMSDVFIGELGLGRPAHVLEVGSGSRAHQLARTVERLEPVLREERPDLVLVVGDVNSTLGAALAALACEIPIGHVEAGLRSFDRSMPEETNRVLVDAVSELLFTHSPEARENLLREGAAPEAIHEVGNTMIDTLVFMRDRIAAADTAGALGLEQGGYLAVTLHRPSLVDDDDRLTETIEALRAVSEQLPVVFAVHPRTRASLRRLGLDGATPALRLVDPLPYVAFLSLVASAAGVLTDSGGIQEETTHLGVPCLTLREHTERPVTVELGTNVLLGLDPARILEAPELIEAVRRSERSIPAGWDGCAAERVVRAIERRLGVATAVGANAARVGV
jgi:UDP-N-acetylglucosamine 2-epimerase (non-hydrolysing)